jgi:hypothetical protein
MVVIDTRNRRGRHPRRPGGKSADGQVLGALLVLAGVGWLVQQSGLVSLSVMTMLSALLLALGIGMVVTARRAGGGGLVLLGFVLTVALASASAVDAGVLQRGVGERNFTPTSRSAMAEPFQLGAGSLTLDLTSDDLDHAELLGRRVKVQVGMGEIVVLLPPETEVPVRIVGEARAGQVDVLGVGAEDGGTNLRRTFEDQGVEGGADARLELDLDVGLGSIQVVRRPAG